MSFLEVANNVSHDVSTCHVVNSPFVDHINNIELGGNLIIQYFSPFDQKRIDKNRHEAYNSYLVDIFTVGVSSSANLFYIDCYSSHGFKSYI